MRSTGVSGDRISDALLHDSNTPPLRFQESGRIMSRIGKRFEELRAAKEGGLVCFVTAGDPDIETTRKIILEMAKAGADIIEVGIPFSDPIADGPSIQAASMRSLANGTTPETVFDLVSDVRRESEVPLVLMTYYNPVYRYGIARFAEDCANAGVDGVIVTDVIPEEAPEWKAAADIEGVDTIFLLAPTSTEDRISRVAHLSEGFIYCVSRTGVTGRQTDLAQGVRDLVALIRARTEKPVVVGFGISTPAHVREVCEYADGAVVGSLLVDRIAAKSGAPDLLSEVHGLVASLKAGTQGSR